MSEARHKGYSEQFVNFIAGLLAGFISVTTCNPLDIARTRLNVIVSILSSRMDPVIKKIMANILTSHML